MNQLSVSKDLNKDPKPFTPELMDWYRDRTEALRADVLFDTDGDPAEALAEQHFLLALTALEQAKTHFRLASIYQSRALVDMRLGR